MRVVALALALTIVAVTAQGEEREVRVFGRDAGISLAGTFIPPSSPHPLVAILLGGAGPTTRSGLTHDKGPLTDLAAMLAARGVGSVRFDKRGIAGSSGSYFQSTIETQAEDAECWVEYVERACHLTDAAIAIVGHSEGGLAALLVANHHPGLRCGVMLATPGLPGPEFILAQDLEKARHEGDTDAQIDAIRRFVNEITMLVKAEPDWQKRRTAIAKLSFPIPAGDDADRVKRRLVDYYASPHFASFVRFDVSRELARCRVPVLSIFSTSDQQVDAAVNAAAFRPLNSAMSKRTVITLPKLDHFMRDLPESGVENPRWITGAFSARAGICVVNWIVSLHADDGHE